MRSTRLSNSSNRAPRNARIARPRSRYRRLILVNCCTETVLNKHAARIPEGKRDDWKKAILANRADAEKLLEGLPERKPAAAPARIHNTATAATPRAQPGSDGATAEGQRRELVEGIRNRQNCTFSRAWEIGRSQRPDLFQAAASN